MDFQQIFSYGLLLVFLITVGYTLVTLGVMGAGNDSKQELSSQIRAISISNFFLILIFGLMSTYYVESYPTQFNRYIILMIHVSIFLSLLSVSIATLQKSS